MNKRWLRRIGPIVAALLLALVVSSLQVAPSRADTSSGTQGEINLDFPNPPGKTPGGPGSGGSGGVPPEGTPAADPDEFSVNSPHMNAPVVDTQRVPVRLDWTLVMRVWLENLAIFYLIRRV
jgi:hypothetical protein